MSEDNSEHKPRMWIGIRRRLIFTFVFSVVCAVLIGVAAVYATGLTSIQVTLGQTFCQIATRVAGSLETKVFRDANIVRDLAADVLTTEVTMEQNNLYRNRPDEWIAARLSRQAKEWKSATNQGRQKDLNPYLSRRLSVLKGLGEGAIKDIEVYDAHGVLVAASGAARHRVASGMAWYRAVAEKAQHFTYVQLDPDQRSLLIAAPVWGGWQGS